MPTQPTPNWDLVEYRHRYVGTDGSPITGRVIFTPRATRLVDAAALTTLIGRAVAVDLVAGVVSVFLPASDDPDILPFGFTWSIQEDFVGGVTREVSIPIAMKATGVEGSLLVESTTSPGTWTPLPYGDHLVIAEAYLNGGSAGATYINKYARIYNPTSSTVNLNGKTLQYRTASSSVVPTDLVQLVGTMAPRTSYLIRLGSNGAVGAVLADVAVDATGVNPAATGGTLYIANSKVGVLPTDPLVIDRLGWGTSNAPETSAATVPSVTTALKRSIYGADTGNNAVDFTVGAPTPNATA